MEYRVCSKCYVEKPLTDEFFGPQQRNWSKLHTECRACKKAYIKQWQANKRAEQEVDRKRNKHMYTIKELTEEEKRERLIKAYAFIYNEAYDSYLTIEEIEKLID